MHPIVTAGSVRTRGAPLMRTGGHAGGASYPRCSVADEHTYRTFNACHAFTVELLAPDQSALSNPAGFVTAKAAHLQGWSDR